MTHVELSLSEPFTPTIGNLDPALPPMPVISYPGDFIGGFTTVDRWVAAVNGANEAALVIDSQAVIAAASPMACTLLGFGRPEAAIGQCLYADVLPLLDFTSSAGALAGGDFQKIPPILALTSGRLARGLLRVRCGGDIVTMDAVATPLWERGVVIGSLTFFCLI